jgi:molecular chaperone DnaJ
MLGEKMASQARDYYDILGVSKSASAEELKRAYRNLARKFHPDVNRSPDAAEKFKEIQEAYDTLSDESKRRQYDRFGPAGLNGGMAGAPGGFSGGFESPLNDIFDIFFNQGSGPRTAQPARGDDLREDLELTLEEVATGVEKTIRFQRMESCDTCQGSGARPGSGPETCPQCSGSGQVRFTQNTLLGTFSAAQPCSRCRGTGRIVANPCGTCAGTGRIKKMRERSVKIPAGIDTGQRLRLVGEGDAGERGAQSGDLYLFIYVKDHEVFERRGNDLYCEAPISFARAALGDTIRIPVLGGTEDLKIPEGTQPGQVFTLKGKGLPDINGRGKGDQYVLVKVQVPTRLTHEQKELLRQFALSTGEQIQTSENKGILGRIFGG